jgi:prolipoprotein diacylglyceryltransferase
MGYILGDKSAPIYRFTSVLNISMGQILSFLMIAAGALILWRCSKAERGEAEAPSDGAAAKGKAASAEARRLRKRIK